MSCEPWVSMSGIAQSSELNGKDTICIFLDCDEDNEEANAQLGDLKAEILKLRRTISDQEQLINEFLENEDHKEVIDTLQTANDDLKRNVNEVQIENIKLKKNIETGQIEIDTLNEKMEKMQQVVNEYQEFLNDILDSKAKDETYLPLDPCAICQEEFQRIKTLKCRHSFHNQCISKWLEENESCPMCRSAADDN